MNDSSFLLLVVLGTCRCHPGATRVLHTLTLLRDEPSISIEVLEEFGGLTGARAICASVEKTAHDLARFMVLFVHAAGDIKKCVQFDQVIYYGVTFWIFAAFFKTNIGHNVNSDTAASLL